MLQIQPFEFLRLPNILFGPGKFDLLRELAKNFGNKLLLVTSPGFPERNRKWDQLLSSFAGDGLCCYHATIQGEPTPEAIDDTVDGLRNAGIEAVVAIGGGSVMDAGKAISAMLPQKGSVIDYLEGVGRKKFSGLKVPFIAVPTTAGTGSEATKNAVISRIGKNGFKKSLRHDNLVPDVAVIDPELMLTCPLSVRSSCGMDVFVQLLESYISTNGSSLTDTLAWSGFEHISNSLLPICLDGTNDINMWNGMAYAALLSGIILANAGLGVVHGLAGPIGGFFNIPHGIICGTLAAASTAVTIRKLQADHGSMHPALRKLARVGVLLIGGNAEDTAASVTSLVDTLNKWTEKLQIPRLGKFEIGETDLDKIVVSSDSKYNPVPLSPDEMKEVLRMRL